MYTDYPGYGSLHRREFIVYLRKYNRPVSDRHLTKRENTALIYNRRDTARESVTTQISTEYILFVSLFNNSKNGIAYRFFLIS